MSQTTDTQTQRASVNRPPDGQMVRPLDDRVVAGVALAVANRLGMSPGAIRLIFFVLAWFGGLGILLYVAGWVLIPEEGATQSMAEDAMGRMSDSTAWLGVALIIVAGVMLVTLGGWVRADVAWAVALLAVGVLLYRGQFDTMFEPRSTKPTAPEAIEPEAVAFEGIATPTVARDDGDGEPPFTAESPVVQRAPRRRQKSILGRLTIGTAFIGIGVMAILDSTDLAHPAFSHYMALFVGIIGLGLLVGSVIGRSRGLIFLGVLLVPVMIASSVVSARFSGGWGSPEYRPATVSDIESNYNLTGGDLQLDLTRVDFSGTERSVTVDVGFGRIVVLVPEGVGVDARGHVGFGDLQLLGDHSDGVDVATSVFLEGDGLLFLDLDVGFGAIEIREVSR